MSLEEWEVRPRERLWGILPLREEEIQTVSMQQGETLPRTVEEL